MSSKNQQAKNWCFTLQNYTDEDVEKIRGLRDVVYLVAGKEVASTGTRHLQGFVQFQSKKRMRQIQNMIKENLHCSVARSVNASIDYCKKDGDYVEIGNAALITKSGKRTDLDLFKEAVKQGERNPKVLRDTFSSVAANHPLFFNQYIMDNVPTRVFEGHEMYSWQKLISEKLNGKPDKRTILFVVDLIGDTGKTWFAHYYCSKHEKPEQCQVMVPGKKVDMAYTLIPEPLVVFFDCPRSKQGEFIQYDFLEEVKNGFVFSSKYESRNKSFEQPHVVVLMNEQPDMTKLSMDRYQIIELGRTALNPNDVIIN